MVTDEERAVFGFLGRIPEEIMRASVQVVVEYKALAEDAAKVARMRSGAMKEMEAKQIEKRYYDLIKRAKKELERNEN